MNAEFYRGYLKQNPVKYRLKYGELTPEEVAAKFPVTPAQFQGPIKVEISQPAAVELELKEQPVEPAVEQPKPVKKGGKKQTDV